MPSSDRDAPKFQIFRARDASDYAEHGPMAVAAMPETVMAGMMALGDAGLTDGARVKLLYSRPGMSLTYCWFKSGYPLPLHSHSADCLYFVIAGELKIGTEMLAAGDGFFLGSDVPYAYVAGDQGVEVLEFRTSDSFDFQALGKTDAYWTKMLASLIAAKPAWPAETRAPSGIEVG